MDADVIVVDVFAIDATTDAFCELKMTQWVKVVSISYRLKFTWILCSSRSGSNNNNYQVRNSYAHVAALKLAHNTLQTAV